MTAYGVMRLYIKSGANNLTCKIIVAWANVGATVSRENEPYAKEKQVYYILAKILSEKIKCPDSITLLENGALSVHRWLFSVN